MKQAGSDLIMYFLKGIYYPMCVATTLLLQASFIIYNMHIIYILKILHGLPQALINHDLQEYCLYCSFFSICLHDIYRMWVASLEQVFDSSLFFPPKKQSHC